MTHTFWRKVYPQTHQFRKMANRKTSFQKLPMAKMPWAAKLYYDLAEVLNSKQIIHKIYNKIAEISRKQNETNQSYCLCPTGTVNDTGSMILLVNFILSNFPFSQ